MNKKPVLPVREKSKPIVFARRTAAQNLLWADYARLFTWRAVGAEYGVSVGAVYRLAVLGKEPRDNAIRARLGLPALASAPVCQACGVVPLAKRCPTCRQRAREAAFERNSQEYDEWRQIDAVKLAAMVSWAEGQSA